jgi:hypothetical protein
MVKIGDEVLFIDATEPLLPFLKLPERCINVEGIVVKPRVEQWVRLQQDDFAKTQWDFRITPIPANNHSFVEITNYTFGPPALRNRRRYATGKDRFLEYLNRRYNINSVDVDISNEKELEHPFIVSFETNFELESQDDKLFIHPFCNLSTSSNPFRQTTRTLPVDLMYLRGEAYNTTIVIPEGYKVNFLPSEAKMDNPILYFQYLAQVTDNTITIEAEYNLKKDIYPASEYRYLKNGMNLIIQKLSEVVILEKK